MTHRLIDKQIYQEKLSAIAENDTLIGKEYKVIETLGMGAFGKVVKAKRLCGKKYPKFIAIKIEILREGRGFSIAKESMVYNNLKGIEGIPKFIDYQAYDIDNHFCNLLVTELLGPSIEQFFCQCNKEFSLKTVLMIGIQMLELVKKLHENGYIHGDIKPSNFVFGLRNKKDKLHLIDFGLSRRYINPENNEHILCKRVAKFCGTVSFASINSHDKISLSRRDDLESLSYTLIYLINGYLPWQFYKISMKREVLVASTKKKHKFSKDQYLPEEILTFLNYTRNLSFDADPNYDYLKHLILVCMVNYRITDDLNFDWKNKDIKPK